MGSQRYLENISRVTGLAQNELVGRKWQEVSFLSAPEAGQQFWEQALGKREPLRLPELPSPNGLEFVWDCTLTPLLDTEHNEQVRYLLLSLLEITEQVQTRHNLEQVDTLREEFIAMATHELRGPLTTLKGNAQLLQRMLQRGQDGEQERPTRQREMTLTRQIVHQVERMNRLIGEMFDAARLRGQAVLHLEEHVDLMALIQRVIDAYGVQGREIYLHADGQQLLGTYDPDRIEQVLHNLLSNALKYSPAEKPVQITVQQNAREVVVAVQDEGRGIDEEDQAHIFDRFYRTEHARRGKADGLGLGLYIVHEIIKQHGGRMWLKSHLGDGSTFFFSLPLAPDQEER
jgi:two-component system, chemotaxis family, CheB/CheR fusion protein